MQRRVHLEKMKLWREHLMMLEEADTDWMVSRLKEFVQGDFVSKTLHSRVMKIQELLDENTVRKEWSMDEDL